MDLAAPQYCQVCLFSEINEQMAHKPASGHGGKRCVFLCVCSLARVKICEPLCVRVCGCTSVYGAYVCPCMLRACALVCVCVYRNNARLFGFR